MRLVLGRLKRRLTAGGESGFTMVELVAATAILTVGFLTLMAATTTGLRLLTQSRQRQVTAEEANGRLEHLRNVPFDDVELSTQPVRSPDPANPDYYVSADGTGYDYGADGTYETLIVDTAAGQVPHIETETVGTTALTAYQYVTWADQPDVKRVTIVVVQSAPAPGRERAVQVSALVTRGTVTVGGSASSATQGSTGTPTPTPTPTASCSGDTAPPGGNFSILSGTGASDGFTASTSITLSLSPSDSCTPITASFSNDGTSFSGTVTYDSTNPTATWTVAPGDGVKQVWARFADGVGNAVVRGPDSIRLDQTLPTTPATISRTVSCSGNDRTVTLSWGASTDANFLGYRVYRSIDDGPYESILTVSVRTASNTHLKTLDSVRFKVVGYDRAGNESAPSPEASLAKNQCS